MNKIILIFHDSYINMYLQIRNISKLKDFIKIGQNQSLNYKSQRQSSSQTKSTKKEKKKTCISIVKTEIM